MYKSSNIVAAISGIVISIGTISTTASATPKSFFIEGQILASNKKEKLRDKATGFADKAQEYAEEAKAKAKEAAKCCKNTGYASFARSEANMAQKQANFAKGFADKALNTNNTSELKDLKNKAKKFATNAEMAANRARFELNRAIKQEKENLINDAPYRINVLKNKIRNEKKYVDSAKKCCSNQEIYPGKAIENVEKSAEVTITYAEESISVYENIQASKTLAEIKKLWKKGAILWGKIDKQSRNTARQMRLAQRYPDDFSDLKGRCGFEEYEEKGKIAYKISNKRWAPNKVRYKGLDWEKFIKKYC